MREVARGQTGKGPSTSSAVSAPLPLQKVAGNYRGAHKLQPAHQRVAGSTPPISGSTPIRPKGACRYHMSTVKHTTQSRPTYHIHQEANSAHIHLTRHSVCWKNADFPLLFNMRLSQCFASDMAPCKNKIKSAVKLKEAHLLKRVSSFFFFLIPLPFKCKHAFCVNGHSVFPRLFWRHLNWSFPGSLKRWTVSEVANTLTL